MSFVKALGAVGLLLAAAAMVMVAAPRVHGQVARRGPSIELRTHLLGGSYIGVAVRDADEADVRRAELPEPTGAVIDEVRRDSPAAEAGLRAGDVITRFDAERVRSARHFERLLSETPAGRQVEMSVMRSGESLTLTVAPEAAPSLAAGLAELPALRHLDVESSLRGLRHLPETLSLVVPRLDREASGRLIVHTRGRLGVGAQELTDQLGEYFGAPEGVLIATVDEDSPARTAGLRAGDVITRIDDHPVRSLTELRRRLDDAGEEASVTFVRDRQTQTVTVTLEDRTTIRRRIIR